MVLISHNVLLKETISGEKRTTWRKIKRGTHSMIEFGGTDRSEIIHIPVDKNQLWCRIKDKMFLVGGKISGQHYWKVRVPKDKKPFHFIGTSEITRIEPRHINSVNRCDAWLDGFKGSIKTMKSELSRLNDDDQEWYWKISYIPGWWHSASGGLVDRNKGWR